MLVDHEALVNELEAYVHTRPSHGQRDLLLKISELRMAHRVPEGLLEKALRLFGVRLTREPLLTVVGDPAVSDPEGVGFMEDHDNSRSGLSPTEESPHASPRAAAV